MIATQSRGIEKIESAGFADEFDGEVWRKRGVKDDSKIWGPTD